MIDEEKRIDDWIDTLLVARTTAVHTAQESNEFASNAEIADIANGLLEKLKTEAKQALLEMIREAKIEAHRRGYEYGAKWDNAMFRRANIADPKKPVNLDEVLRLAIERYSDEDEAHTTRRA